MYSGYEWREVAIGLFALVQLIAILGVHWASGVIGRSRWAKSVFFVLTFQLNGGLIEAVL